MSLRSLQHLSLLSLGLSVVGATWWGCTAEQNTFTTASSSGSGSPTGSGGAGGHANMASTSSGDGGGRVLGQDLSDSVRQRRAVRRISCGRPA